MVKNKIYLKGKNQTRDIQLSWVGSSKSLKKRYFSAGLYLSCYNFLAFIPSKNISYPSFHDKMKMNLSTRIIG